MLDKVDSSDVVIIGAGLAGTALALAFHNKSIPCRIYEARSLDTADNTSGVVLTANGLKILDDLGVLKRIESRCWLSEFRTFKNDKDETISKTAIQNDYGYKNHRCYRRVLHDEMKLMLQERGVPILYDTKFEGILSDTSESITFQINGKQESTSLLVGADGIYSSVRKHVSPAIQPEYTGVLGIMSHINRSTVEWPYANYEKACTIQGRSSAMFMIPEVADGSEIMVGMQLKHPAQTRAEWEALSADKDRLAAFYRQGYDDWHHTGKSIIDSVCAHKETLYMWPFQRMPRLEAWYSPTGRVVLIGDAAHALPPSSGQGVNQALEDVQSLVLLLTVQTSKPRIEALRFWQGIRQDRIDRVYDWATNTTNVQRLPEAERQKLIKEGKYKDLATTVSKGEDPMRWLYQPRIEEVVREWAEQ